MSLLLHIGDQFHRGRRCRVAVLEGRVRIAPVPANVLEDMLTGRWKASSSDAPADLEIIGIFADADNLRGGRISLVVASASFTPTPVGNRFEEIFFTFTSKELD